MLDTKFVEEHKARLAEIAKITSNEVAEQAIKVAIEKHTEAVKADNGRQIASFAAQNDEAAHGEIDRDVITKSTRREDVIAFQKWSDDCYILRKILGRKGIDFRSTKKYQQGVRKHQPILKALYTTQVGGIYEWIPTEMSAQVIDAIAMERLVTGLFDTIDMPTPTYTPPTDLSDTEAYLLTEETTDDPTTGIKAGTFVSSSFSLTAKKLGLRFPISEEAVEDSITPILGRINARCVRAVARARENAILNGDITATHQDADVTTAMSYSAQRAWKGLRKHALANSLTVSFANNIPSDAYLMQVQLKMGKYGVNPKQQALILGMRAYIGARQNITAIRTADQWGGTDSAFRTGAFAVWGGVPVIVSELMKENLNASGVYDLTTQAYGSVLLVNRSAWVNGERRKITLKSTVNDMDQQKVICTWRGDFASIYGSAATSCALGYYVKVS